MWGVKASVVPVVIGGLGAVTPKLEAWLQQIPGTTLRSPSRRALLHEKLKYCAGPSGYLFSQSYLDLVFKTELQN